MKHLSLLNFVAATFFVFASCEDKKQTREPGVSVRTIQSLYATDSFNFNRVWRGACVKHMSRMQGNHIYAVFVSCWCVAECTYFLCYDFARVLGFVPKNCEPTLLH